MAAAAIMGTPRAYAACVGTGCGGALMWVRGGGRWQNGVAAHLFLPYVAGATALRLFIMYATTPPMTARATTAPTMMPINAPVDSPSDEDDSPGGGSGGGSEGDDADDPPDEDDPPGGGGEGDSERTYVDLMSGS